MPPPPRLEVSGEVGLNAAVHPIRIDRDAVHRGRPMGRRLRQCRGTPRPTAVLRATHGRGAAGDDAAGAADPHRRRMDRTAVTERATGRGATDMATRHGNRDHVDMCKLDVPRSPTATRHRSGRHRHLALHRRLDRCAGTRPGAQRAAVDRRPCDHGQRHARSLVAGAICPTRSPWSRMRRSRPRTPRRHPAAPSTGSRHPQRSRPTRGWRRQRG